MPGLRHLVVGDGAVGCFLAARLARAGVPVQLTARSVHGVERRSIELRQAMREDLVAEVVSIPWGEVEAEDAVAWVAVKEAGLGGVIESGCLDGAATVVPLLNGVDHLGRLRRGLPEAAVTAGSIWVLADRLRTGVVSVSGLFAQVDLANAANERVATTLDGAASDLVAAGIGVDRPGSDGNVLWRKAAFYLPVALGTIVVGGPVGKVRRDAEVWEHVRNAVAEVAEIARSQKVLIDIGFATERLGMIASTMTTSVQRDIAKGNLGEFHYILSGPVADALNAGLALPSLRWLRGRAENATGHMF